MRHPLAAMAGVAMRLPVAMDSSDAGSWDALHDIAAKGSDAKVVQGNAAAGDSRNFLVHSDGPELVAVGVEDISVVATEGALIVLSPRESQRVRERADHLPPARSDGEDDKGAVNA